VPYLIFVIQKRALGGREDGKGLIVPSAPPLTKYTQTKRKKKYF
jgi:hypothetical protein